MQMIYCSNNFLRAIFSWMLGHCLNSEIIGMNVFDDRLQSLVNQPMALLNIPSIDHEHTECEEALHTFIQQRTTTALKAFLDILIKHFIHEEELMRDVGFGGAKVVSSDEGGINSSMSAMTAYSGHVADHHGIRDLIEQVIDTSEGGTVCQGKVMKVVDRFKAHIDRYDVLYQEDFLKAGVQ